MASSDGFRKYVEAGAVLGQVTRARAEEIVRELVGAGELQRGQAQQWVDDLVERSRKTSEALLQLIRTEVTRQIDALGADPEHLAKQVADILRQSADAGRQATRAAAGTASATVGKTAKAAKKAASRAAARPGGAKKAAKKKAAAKKAPAKKAPAKKAPAKKAPAKKAAAKKKAPAKKAASRSAGAAGNGTAGTTGS